MTVGRVPFSIVVPTRNRASLLRQALTTVLAQTYPDFEVVVSDNHSTDATASVVQAFGDPRVRYLRPGRPLPLADNWEWAVEQTRGEWVMVLGDDDGIVPTLLERITGLIGEHGVRAVAWRKARYVHPGFDPPWPHPHEENLVFLHPYTGAIEEVAARPVLERLFRLEFVPVRPEINSVVHREAIARLRELSGRCYLAPDPAYSFCAGFLALERSYLAVDVPLVLMGLSTASISTTFVHNLAEAHAGVAEYDTEDLLSEVPLRCRVVPNLAAESLLRRRHTLPGELAPFALDPVRYFVDCRLALDRADNVDHGAVAEWRAVLRRQPGWLRRAVLRRLLARRARGGLRAAVRRVPGASALRAALRRHVERRSDFRIIDGREHGFSDLAGAARFVDGLLPAPVAPAEVGR